MLAPFLEPGEEREYALFVACHRGAIVARVGSHREVLLDGELGEDATALGHEREAAARDLVHAAADEVLARVHDAPHARGNEPRDRLKRRRLARAVGADEAHQLTRLDGDVDALHGADTAVGDLQSLEGKQHHAALGLPR